MNRPILTADEQAEWDAVIDAEVAAAPPLRPEQIATLSALFDCQPDNSGAA
jgi:hypothetical protein